MNKRIEIVASGFGGQGVVRLGQIIGETGVKQGLHVTMLKSHGTEMRGGYVRNQVVLSEAVIDSPMCENPDYFIALSSSAYNRFKDSVADSGLIIYDPSFVDEIDATLECTQKAFPAKQLSMDNFNTPLFANTLVLGLVAKEVKLLDPEVVINSILAIIPKFHAENRKAYRFGYDYAG